MADFKGEFNMKDLLFVAIDLHGKKCTIIGGGKVAERKVKKLLLCGADVKVVAPEVTDIIEELAHNGKISIQKRTYRKGDLISAFLVVIATDDNTANMEALNEAVKLDILINAAFSRDYGNLFFTATRETNGFVLSAISKAESPVQSVQFLDGLIRKLESES